MRTILVAVDLDASSEEVVAAALAHGAPAGDHVVLVHVVPDAPLDVPEGGIPITGGALGGPNVPQLVDAARQALAPIAQRLRATTASVDVVVSSGAPAVTILDLIEAWSADLVVIGTHGRRGLARMLVGSVAESVLRRSAVPVLVVPVKQRV